MNLRVRFSEKTVWIRSCKNQEEANRVIDVLKLSASTNKDCDYDYQQKVERNFSLVQGGNLKQEQ